MRRASIGTVFGAIIALVGCHFGMTTRGGATNVGHFVDLFVAEAKTLVTLPSDLEVSQVVWARSVLVSENALDDVQGRAA